MLKGGIMRVKEKTGKYLQKKLQVGFLSSCGTLLEILQNFSEYQDVVVH